MRRPLAFAFAALTLTGLLSACAPPAEPDAEPTPSASVAPEPAPTAEARVVAPGEKPPSVFDDDCSRALSPADLTEATGTQLVLASSTSDGDVGNAGGLSCNWEAEAVALRIEIMPRAGLGDAEFPVNQEPYYFEDCDPQWVCSGRAENDDLWLSASFQAFPEADRSRIDEWTAALAATVFRNFAGVEHESWVRDRTGWWDDLDCAALAGTMSRELATEFTGDGGGFIDPPLPGVLMATAASNWSNCYLSDGAHTFEVYASAGEAWTLPATADAEPFDTGVPGISAWQDSSYQSTTSAGYALTDGVNALTAYVPTDATWTAEQAITALAKAAVAGWR